MLIDLNVNDSCKLRLTDVGRKRMREIFPDDYLAQIHSTFDTTGEVEMQLWEAMQVFGSCMGNGFPVPFETNIQIDSTQC